MNAKLASEVFFDLLELNFLCKSSCNENNLETQKKSSFMIISMCLTFSWFITYPNWHIQLLCLVALHFLGLQVEQKIYLNTKMASGKLNWGTKNMSSKISIWLGFFEVKWIGWSGKGPHTMEGIPNDLSKIPIMFIIRSSSRASSFSILCHPRKIALRLEVQNCL